MPGTALSGRLRRGARQHRVGPTVLPGHLAANIGVIVLDIQDVLHVYDAVTKAKPVIERTVALCGPASAKPACTGANRLLPLEHLAAGKLRQDRAYRLLRNSALTGEPPEMKQPVDRNCDAVTRPRK